MRPDMLYMPIALPNRTILGTKPIILNLLVSAIFDMVMYGWSTNILLCSGKWKNELRYKILLLVF
jgi:hypothetical protein